LIELLLEHKEAKENLFINKNIKEKKRINTLLNVESIAC